MIYSLIELQKIETQLNYAYILPYPMLCDVLFRGVILHFVLQLLACFV